METDNKNLTINLKNQVNEEETRIANQIVAQEDLKNFDDLTTLFNAVQVKKNVLRVQKLNDLLDKVTDGIAERLEKVPDEFSNKDLLDYLSVMQSAVEKAQKGAKLVDNAPTITLSQQNNQQININVTESDVDKLSRESKNKIMDVINSILNSTTTPSDIAEIPVDPENIIID